MAYRISHWLMGAVLLLCAGQASAVAIGPNLPREQLTVHAFRPVIGGWCVAIECTFGPNGNLDPYVISADPEAGVWLKALAIPGDNPVPVGTEAVVLELLQVGTGPAWRDWHERITIFDLGWHWLEAMLLTGDFDEGLASFLPASGLAVNFSPGGLEVSFEFDPLPVGTDILIVKQIGCRNPNGCAPDAILIAEYPSIPEPTTLALLGIALAGLGFGHRRKLR